MSMHGDHDMGHTVAGWTGTCTAVLGGAVAGVALAADSTGGLVAGGAVVVLAAVVTWVLHLAGWGKPSGPRPVAQHPWRIRDTAARGGHPDCLGCRLAGRKGAVVPVAAPTEVSADDVTAVAVAAAAAERAPAVERVPAEERVPAAQRS
ncbi:HGxxPAAW family protein [Streptomyces flavofungini]|uniref:HGxxPAAW family protein n=1 Tax=Streptomyces flavofungini TaxID=68200 RepID=UPI0025B01EA0|nr:HGxxPAAW family protein [Streptomyces flavofungini]WJV50944.1 HGxxPAAW family protein [Streptomyces flavofungini]